MKIGDTIVARWKLGKILRGGVLVDDLKPANEQDSHCSAAGEITAIDGDLVTIEGKATVKAEWVEK